MSQISRELSPPIYPQWLDDAVIYQVFPPSFCDSNGDGIGDLQGITSKLDYIQELGCNTLWLSPIWDSPFQDAGYDVRDYYKIAPRYGTLEDFEALIAQAHKRGLRVLMDFIPGHTSAEHPWFKESCKHERNEYSDWYIWTDKTFYPAFDEPHSFVIGHGERIGNYMSNFFYYQPALNYGYAEPDPSKPWQLSTDAEGVCAVRQEMFNIMRYWLDKGVDGYRVDMASSLVKGAPEQVREAMVMFWHSVRQWWDRDYPDALLLAEWSNPSLAIESGFHLDFMIHFGEAGGMRLFRGEDNLTILARNDVSYFNRSGGGDFRAFFSEYSAHMAFLNERGKLSIPSGNHDLPRYCVGRDEMDLKLIQTFLFTIPHVPTLYYGDEIGMRHQGHLPSKEGGYDRTGARTPMQWDASEGVGFSEASPEAFYLPVDEDCQRPCVSEQRAREDSLLNAIKELICLRKNHQELGSTGGMTLLSGSREQYPLVYLRSLGQEASLVAINPLDHPTSLSIRLAQDIAETLLGDGTMSRLDTNTQKVELAPRSAWVVKLAR